MAQKAMRATILSMTLALLGLWGPHVEAFEMSPMSLHLEASGATGGSGRLTVRNTRGSSLPLETRAMRRYVSEDGAMRMEPADADFLIFPPQALVPPGGAQAFQFRYVGGPLTQEGRAYVLYASEVPVSEIRDAGIDVVFELGAAVYLYPPGATSDLRLESVQPAPGGGLEVLVRNLGARYAVLGLDGLNAVPGAAAALAPYRDALTRPDNPIIPPHALRRFRVGQSALRAP